MKRRAFLEAWLAGPLAVAGGRAACAADVSATSSNQKESMYGLIVQLKSTPGDREQLIQALLKGTEDLPGCKLYAIAADAADEVSIWITEFWESEEAHLASLKLPEVRQLLTQLKPMIAGMGERHVVTPIGGRGVA